ncbi:MAG TPA: helix-turn-helix domain-containing protein [Solirubrobacterales bacterium]|jgi:AcrR family transcriptional regulator|nr:helix-turn-helix domain-containing protein [Solirubrobacterales bacterium]
MVELAADQGYEKVTVRGLSRLAGVSTGTFYKHFQGVEECFASTYESLMQRALRRAYTAQRETNGGEEGVRAALQLLLTDFANHPKEAKVALFEAYAAGPALHPSMIRAASALARIIGDDIAGGQPEATTRQRLSQGIAAGVTRVMRARFTSGQDADLPALGGELGDWVMALSSFDVAHREAFQSRLRARADREPVFHGSLPQAAEDERGRILSAIAKLSLNDGSSTLTVSRICSQAGVSRRAFKAEFADVEEGFLESIEAIVTAAAARARQADDRGIDIDRMVHALCAEVAQDPPLGHLCLIDLFEVGREALMRRDRWLSLATEQLQIEPPWEGASTVGLEASLAGAWRIAEAEIAAGRARALPRLGPLLSRFVLTPMQSETRPAAELVRA